MLSGGKECDKAYCSPVVQIRFWCLYDDVLSDEIHYVLNKEKTEAIFNCKILNAIEMPVEITI